MQKEFHLRQLVTSTSQITPSWTPSSCTQEESDYSQCAPTRWTYSASWIQCEESFTWRLGCVSLPQTPWNHRRLGVSTTATSSAADRNIPQCRRSVEWLYCWAMGMWRSGLPWDEPTKQSLLPVSDTRRVQIYPVWGQEAGHENVLWQGAEGRKHCSAFPKLHKWGWSPEAHD